MSDNKDWRKFESATEDCLCIICGGDLFGMGFNDGTWENGDKVHCNNGCAYFATIETDEDSPLKLAVGDEWDFIIGLRKDRDALRAELEHVRIRYKDRNDCLIFATNQRDALKAELAKEKELQHQSGIEAIKTRNDSVEELRQQMTETLGAEKAELWRRFERMTADRDALRVELADAKKLASDLICENQGLKHKIDMMNKEQIK